jgi:hypothetical protein
MSRTLSLELNTCRFILCFWSVITLAGTAQATPIVITFEGLPTTATFAAGSVIPLDAQLSNQYQPNYGVTFSSVQPYVPVLPLGLDHATSGVNGIGMSDANGLVSYSTFIDAIFTVPGNVFAIATTDFVSVRGDLDSTNPGAPLTLVAYDIHGNILATDVQPESPGVTLSISAPGIHGVQILGDGSTAFDDFTFNSVQPIPEPATVILIVLGILPAGLAMQIQRLRRSKALGA